jgi:hypothetical protein
MHPDEVVSENYKSRFRIEIGAVLLYLLLPAVVFIDLSAILCNNTIFRIVGIPRTKRKDYIRPFSRFKLPEVSMWYKLGCVYCSYANGVAYYVQVTTMKIEFLYCPWKQKNKTKISHHRFFKDW